jgi:hypothetical protein
MGEPQEERGRPVRVWHIPRGDDPIGWAGFNPPPGESYSVLLSLPIGWELERNLEIGAVLRDRFGTTLTARRAIGRALDIHRGGHPWGPRLRNPAEAPWLTSWVGCPWGEPS